MLDKDIHQPVDKILGFSETSEKNIVVLTEKDFISKYILIGIGTLIFCVVLFLAIWFFCKKSKSVQRISESRQTHVEKGEEGISSKSSQKPQGAYKSISNTHASNHFYQPLEGEYAEIEESLMLVSNDSAVKYANTSITSRKTMLLNENSYLNANLDEKIVKQIGDKTNSDAEMSVVPPNLNATEK